MKEIAANARGDGSSIFRSGGSRTALAGRAGGKIVGASRRDLSYKGIDPKAAAGKDQGARVVPEFRGLYTRNKALKVEQGNSGYRFKSTEL